jgi:hypothetical protein
MLRGLAKLEACRNEFSEPRSRGGRHQITRSQARGLLCASTRSHDALVENAPRLTLTILVDGPVPQPEYIPRLASPSRHR